MARAIINKTFKGIEYAAYQESPNVYLVKIGRQRKVTASFYMLGEDKIEKIARTVINQIKKYNTDGVISKTETVKLDRFITDLLVKEKVNVKTLTPITRSKDVTAGAVIIPRDVDIVADEDILIVECIINNNTCSCITLDEPVKVNSSPFKRKQIPMNDVIGGYLIVEYITDEVKEYNNYKKQLDSYESFFTKKIKSITTDINETSNTVDDHLEDFIKNAVLESKYNGLLKERMISFIEQSVK